MPRQAVEAGGLPSGGGTHRGRVTGPHDASPPGRSASPPHTTTCQSAMVCEPAAGGKPRGCYLVHCRSQAGTIRNCPRRCCRDRILGLLRFAFDRLLAVLPSQLRGQTDSKSGTAPHLRVFTGSMAIIVTSTQFASRWIARSWSEVLSRVAVRMPRRRGQTVPEYGCQRPLSPQAVRSLSQ